MCKFKQMKKENLVSIPEYAKRCKLTTQAIRKRIKEGLIQQINFNGIYTIDVVKYPPQKRKSVGRPKNSDLLAEMLKSA